MEFRIKYEPREWQLRALTAWLRERRGIVEVVTGGGKTIFGQMCLKSFFSESKVGQALIVVPTVSLLDQWYVTLQDEMGISGRDIGLRSGRDTCDGRERIIIAVINSARNFSEEFSKNRSVFLIVDECHRAGSQANAKALEGQFTATLGLSATPEREYDEGFETYIAPRLGPIIFKYQYVDAARDGVISPFSLTNVRVDLLPDESEKYQSYTRAIAQTTRVSEASNNDYKLKRLLQLRAGISMNAVWRIPMAVKLVELHRGERTVVFHERISSANQIHKILSARGHRATLYHAKVGSEIRRDNLRLFQNGQFDVLVCCRALDEGINVPEASIAVIASSTAGQRQRIQRLGRILRTSPGKAAATIYTIYATTQERIRLEREETNLQGISSVSWQRGIADM